jgi:hypothetical protein
MAQTIARTTRAVMLDSPAVSASSMEDNESTDNVDLDARQLCPDGGCYGVIGDDGTCTVCGRKGDPNAAARVSSASSANDDSSGSDSDGSDTNDEYSGDAPEANEPADASLADRQLCPDGGCIGVIGDDGLCKECGRAA